MKVSTYRGVDITLNEQNWFEFTMDGNKYADPSYANAKDKVDDRVKEREREQTKALDIPAIDIQGRSTHVVGLHAGRDELLMRPRLEEKRFGGKPDLFFDTAHVRLLANEVLELSRKLEKARDELSKYKITWKKNPDAFEPYNRDNHSEYVDRIIAKAKALGLSAGRTER